MKGITVYPRFYLSADELEALKQDIERLLQEAGYKLSDMDIYSHSLNKVNTSQQSTTTTT